MIEINKITPKIASFLVKISEGISPKEALELIVIENYSNIALELKYDKLILLNQHIIFDFLNPQINSRIKQGARLLQMWYLNFDALKDGELKDICTYIDKMNEYFNKE